MIVASTRQVANRDRHAGGAWDFMQLLSWTSIKGSKKHCANANGYGWATGYRALCLFSFDVWLPNSTVFRSTFWDGYHTQGVYFWTAISRTGDTWIWNHLSMCPLFGTEATNICSSWPQRLKPIFGGSNFAGTQHQFLPNMDEPCDNKTHPPNRGLFWSCWSRTLNRFKFCKAWDGLSPLPQICSSYH